MAGAGPLAMAPQSGQPSILIVGAGPTGLSAAIELARRGLGLRIIEAGADLGPIAESRALGVNARTLQLLQPSGVTERILAEARQVRELRFFGGGKRLLTVDATATGGPYRGIHVLPQGRTERILLERLGEFGVTPEWNTRFTGLSSPNGGHRPVCELAGPDGSVERAQFDLVIGADGAHSQVRKAAGLDFPGEAMTETFHLADYVYSGELDTSFVEARLFDPGVIARIPVDARTIRYVSTLPDYRERIDHPAGVVDVPWVSEFRISYRHVEPMSAGSVFLAGDAAHIHSPIGARGMNLGIEDACWLAWLVSEGRQAEYSDLRMPAARAVLADTRRNTRMILMKGRVALALRDLLVPLAASISWVRRRVLRNAQGLDTPAPPWLT